MPLKFTFQEKAFSNIFPFYILIGQDMVVKSAGKTLEKIYAGTAEKSFQEHYSLKRPFIKEQDFQSLKSLTGQLIVIECLNSQRTNLRGQIDFLQDSNELLFLGTPWFNSIEEVIDNGLTLHDFANHDPMTDLLHLMKTQEITNDDLKHLLTTVSKQKDELKAANKAIHDIALFPTQNPDPLIRINYEGEVIQNNPAAAKLDFLSFENRVYRNDDLFKLISTKIDTSKSRWEFEAGSEEKDYSFVCVPMKEEGYINIYGRDITQQLKDRLEVERLSLIIQQTINAVIVTDAAGRIEWVNNAFTKVTGYTLEEVKHKVPGSFLQGQDTDPGTVAYMREKIRNAQPFACEVYNYTKSGNGYWLRINGQPIFDKAGNIVQFFAIEEDITLEKEAAAKLEEFDQRLKVALAKIGDNVWEHDFLKDETSFSQQEGNLLGYSSKDFENNVNFWYSCVHGDDKKLLHENDAKYRAGEIDHHILEYRMVHKDGSTRWVLDRGVVIEKTKDDKPLKIIGTHTDITRQKAIEKELEQRVQQFNSLSGNIPGVIYEYEFRKDGTEGLKYVSPSVEKVFGLTAEQFSEFGTYIHHDDLEKIILKNKESKENLSSFTDEARLVVPGKGIIWHSISSSYSYTTEDGDIVFTGFMMDITERKTVEQKIDEQKKFYEQILNNIPSDIAVFDKSHRYLFLNPMAVKDDELRTWMIGKKDEDYVTKRKKPVSIAEERRKIFNGILETKELKSWEEEMVQPDGSSKFVLRNMYPVPAPDGSVDMVIGYGIDISAIKKIQRQIEESEKRYRDVIDNSLAIITTHDMEGKFISVNPMVSKTYGYTDEEMIGHSLTDFLTQEDKAYFETNYLDQITKEKNFSGTFRVLHKNGNIIYTLFNNFLKEEAGREPYVIGFAVDITERIKAEKELKLAKKITEELALSKQNFLANMSHEIRTPMNAIMGMAGQLGKTNLNKDQAFYLDTIRSASDNLLVIINDILDLSKIEAGKLSLEKIGFEPREIIGRAMQVMKHKAEEKGLAFTNSFCDSKLTTVLLGDPYRLSQILLNLISNAIKFTEKGSVDISCAVIENTESQQRIQATVKDTGIGMDEIFAQKLFQKFSQEDESVTRKYGGTGLGMSICKELVELMGGKIYVESRKGEGTAVIFEITFDKGTLSDLPQKNIIKTDTHIIAGKKILIVDDNKMNRLVAGAMLKNYNPVLLQAVDGVDALEKVKEHQPDIVLMDVQMPELDGIEATKIIRTTISDTLPVIALTALAIKGDEQKCKDAGMNDYLSKPFEETQLVNMVSKWLGSQKGINSITATKELPAQALFSLSKIEELAQGDATFVEEMTDVFIEQAVLSLDQMKTAFEKGDAAAIKKIAHRLKPSIDNMCITALKNEIREIEAEAEILYNNKSLQPKLAHIESVLAKIITQLKKLKETGIR